MVIDNLICKNCGSKDMQKDWVRTILHKNFEVFDIEIYCCGSCYKEDKNGKEKK